MMKKNRIRQFLLAGALALLSTAGHAATVVLQNHASNISVGDEFVVDVLLQDAFTGDLSSDILLAFGLNTSYDNAAFALTSRTVGPLWDDDTSFFDLDLAGSSFPGIDNDGSNTPILLGQLTFAALAAGNFTLGVGSDPLDPNQGPIYLFGVEDIAAQTQVSVRARPGARRRVAARQRPARVGSDASAQLMPVLMRPISMRNAARRCCWAALLLLHAAAASAHLSGFTDTSIQIARSGVKLIYTVPADNLREIVSPAERAGGGSRSKSRKPISMPWFRAGALVALGRSCFAATERGGRSRRKSARTSTRSSTNAHRESRSW